MSFTLSFHMTVTVIKSWVIIASRKAGQSCRVLVFCLMIISTDLPLHRDMGQRSVGHLALAPGHQPGQGEPVPRVLGAGGRRGQGGPAELQVLT